MEENKKSREYWEKRARENENKVYKKAGDLKKDLDEHYIKARREIQKSINDLVARYMDKTELSYVEAMKNLTSSEFKEWKMTLEEYEKEIDRLFKAGEEELANKLRIELETLAMKSRITRLDSLKTQIDIELNRKASRDYDVVKKGISDVYRDFYTINTTDFGLTGVNTVLPDKVLRRLINQPWSGANFSERIWGNAEILGKVLKQEIIQSFIQGISVKDLSDRIEKRFITDRKNTERLVRTELNYALNETTKLSYEEAEIEEYEYLAEIDGRTSDICRELNGQKFKMKDAKVGVNYPPMHPYCRSTTVPVINYENFRKKKIENKKVNKTKKKELERKEKKLEKNGTIEEKVTSITIINNVKNAKTITEINNLCEGYFSDIQSKIKKVNFEGCDLEVAKENAIKLVDLDSRFESDLIEIKTDIFNNADVSGACRPTNESYEKFLNTKGVSKLNSVIRLNVKNLESRAKVMKDWKEYCFSTPISVSSNAPVDEINAAVSTLVHEYGHSILPGKANEFLLKEGGINSKFTTMVRFYKQYMKELKDLEDEINQIFFSYAGKENGRELGYRASEKLRKKYAEIRISAYSTKTVGEFIAEAFCNAELSSNPKKWSIKVHDFIVEYFGK